MAAARRPRRNPDVAPLQARWERLSGLEWTLPGRMRDRARARAMARALGASPWADDPRARELAGGLAAVVGDAFDLRNIRAAWLRFARQRGDPDLAAVADVALRGRSADGVVRPALERFFGPEGAWVSYARDLDGAARAVAAETPELPGLQAGFAGDALRRYFAFASPAGRRRLLAAALAAWRPDALRGATSAERVAYYWLEAGVADPTAPRPDPSAAARLRALDRQLTGTNTAPLWNAPLSAAAAWLAGVPDLGLAALLPEHVAVARSYPAALAALPPLDELLAGAPP